MIRKRSRNNPLSVYKVGENVLIRCPPAKRISRRRRLLNAKSLCKYLIEFKYQRWLVKRTLRKRIPVIDITSKTLNEKKRKRKLVLNQDTRSRLQKYLIPTENPDIQLFSSRISNQGLAISYDLPRDGNCQFSALCHQLTRLTQIGISRSAQTLRKALVVYLRTYPDGTDGFPLQLFAGLSWDEYVKSMACDGTDLWRSLDVTSRCKLLTSSDNRATELNTWPFSNSDSFCRG